MYLQGMTIDRNWEIPQDRLLLTEERLGGGEFGIVTKGIYLRTDGNELPVAVKRLKGEQAFSYLRVGMENGREGSPGVNGTGVKILVHMPSLFPFLIPIKF